MSVVEAKLDQGRQQIQAAYASLSSLGYIHKIRTLKARIKETNGQTVYHQLGDPDQRVIWKEWDRPQTLVAQRYEGHGRGWQDKKELSLPEFIAGAPDAAFVGKIPPLMREVARKLRSAPGQNGNYYFASPVDGAKEQILETSINNVFHRLRVIPGGPEAAILIFEKRRTGSATEWEHLHRTTAARYMEPDYRYDVAVDSLPEPRRSAADPDAPLLRKGLRVLMELIR